MHDFLFKLFTRKKPPGDGYLLLTATWSFDHYKEVCDIYLNLGYGLYTEETIFKRYYVWGRK